MKISSLLLGICALSFSYTLQSCNSNSGNAGNGPVELKLNFKPGAKYKYVKESKESIEPQIKGASIAITQNMTTEAIYQVTPSGKDKNIVFSYERIALKSGNSMMSVEFDSKDTAKQSQKMFQSITDVLHKPYNATITADGNIVSIKKPTSLDTSNATASELNQFSDTALHNMLQQLFNVYPGKSVKVGDTWTTKGESAISFLNASADNTFKLVSISNGIAHIEVNSNLISSPEDNPEIKGLNMRGTQTGMLDMEINTGLIVDYKLSRHMDGTMDMMGISAPTTITSDVHIYGREQ
ncbi:MAG: hypothetical protein JSS96_05155 [Bacteroidetes bacterium]|nr:hypothetical protein [Bacteroidota bacterium]